MRASLLAVLLTVITSQSFSQIISNTKPGVIAAEFLRQDGTVSKGQIISNILKAKNVNGKVIRFTVDVSVPYGWKTIYRQERWYELAPGDSLFIPIRFIPTRVKNGNTKFVINAFLLNENDNQVGNAHFVMESKKRVNWELEVGPSEIIYFKNGQETLPFSVELYNTESHHQDIFMSLKTVRNSAVLYDSTGFNIIKKPAYSFNLHAGMDTTFNFSVGAFRQERNYKRVDLFNYSPSLKKQKEVYKVFVSSKQPSSSPENRFSRNKRVALIKLPNVNEVKPFGGNVVPLTLQSNIGNLLGAQTLMNVTAFGNARLDNEASLFYSTQLTFTSQFWNNNLFNNLPWTVGYNTDKYEVVVGDVSGKSILVNSNGKGITGEYRFNETMAVGGYFVNNPRFFSNVNRTSFGVNHRWKIGDEGRLYSFAGHELNHLTNTDFSTVSTRGTYAFNSRHSASLFLAGSNLVSQADPTNIYNRQGGSIGANYGGSFFDGKFTTSAGGRFNTKYFTRAPQTSYSANVNLTYAPGGKRMVFSWSHNLANNTNYSNANEDPNGQDSVLFYNTNYGSMLGVTGKSKIIGQFNPRIFYRYVDISGSRYVSRGITFRSTNIDLSKNLRWASSFRAGYNRLLHRPDLRDYFVAQVTSQLRYRTLSFTGRYLYGPQSIIVPESQIEQELNPQNLRLSTNYQYQFKNRHFILDNSVTYGYNNLFKNHTVSFIPNMYMFTDSEWRFNVQPSYAFGYSKRPVDFSTPTSVNANQSADDFEDDITKTHSLTIQVGILKKFGIPLPFVESNSVTSDFVCYYDVDGDRKRGKNEPLIENVVIKVDKEEVLTDANGKGTFINIDKGVHKLIIAPLEDMEGWFPYVQQTVEITESGEIGIPFVRGVKVYGSVFIDREKYGAKSGEEMDLSNIKISAMNGETYHTLTGTDGSFEFYMPHSEYIISMDESILGTKFKLLENNLEVKLDEKIESIYLSFYIIERRRKLNIKRFGDATKPYNPNPNQKTLEELEEERRKKLGIEPEEQDNRTLEEKLRDSEKVGVGQGGGTGTGMAPIPGVNTPAPDLNQNLSSPDIPNINQEDMGLIKNPTSNSDPVLGYFSIDEAVGNVKPDANFVKFKVQFGFYQGEMPTAKLYNLLVFSYVEQQETPTGYRRFTSGLFSDYDAAKVHQQELLDKGYEGSFVVGEYDGKTISTKDALQILQMAK